MRAHLRSLVVPGLLVALVTPARAEDSDARVMAESLFREGLKLMDTEDVAQACRKLAASHKLDPASGTLVALATCHEKEGKLASAWGEFTQALATARRDGRADRAGFVTEHLATLEPRVPRVVVDVPQGSQVEGLVVERNGAGLTSVAWGAPLPSDPGEVRVVARAPGRVTWSDAQTVTERSTLRFVVPPLALADKGAIPPGQVAPGDAPPSSAGSSGRRTAAFIVGGTGVLALGIGTVFGVRALEKTSASATAGCGTAATTCSQAGVDAMADARTSARVANVGIGVGIVAVAVAGYLFFTSRTPSATTTSVRIAPDLGKNGGGAQLVGTF